MESRYERQVLVPLSLCDRTARLSTEGAFALFMDIAAEHAEFLGLGGAAMAARHRFWLTVRTRVRFFRCPALLEPVTAATWPGKPEKVRCERYYTLRSGDELLADGKTEWAVMDTDTKGICTLEGLYPPELTLPDETAGGGPFVRMRDAFDEAESARCLVRSTDIDLGGHMNNAAYVRALMGTFSSEERRALDIREMEVCFRAPCYEGETLSVRRRRTGAGTEIAMFRPEGKPALLARILRG